MFVEQLLQCKKLHVPSMLFRETCSRQMAPTERPPSHTETPFLKGLKLPGFTWFCLVLGNYH
jgi:hypothetical protein